MAALLNPYLHFIDNAREALESSTTIVRLNPTLRHHRPQATELNRILPNVTITPPAGYQPGQLVQQRNQQLMDAARAAQPGATPAAPAPTGTAPTTR